MTRRYQARHRPPVVLTVPLLPLTTATPCLCPACQTRTVGMGRPLNCKGDNR